MVVAPRQGVMDPWRTLAQVLAVGCLVALPACYASHGREAAEERPRPASASARADGGTGVTALDAHSAWPHVDAHVPDAGLADPCEDAFRTGVGAACGEWLRCERPIAGVPCCYRGLRCEDGRVSETITCDDDCAQGCRLIVDASDCAAYGCMWIVPEGCHSEIDPEWVNGCVQAVGAWCGSDSDCDWSERCRALAVDPCAGSDCDACFGLEMRCIAQ